MQGKGDNRGVDGRSLPVLERSAAPGPVVELGGLAAAAKALSEPLRLELLRILAEDRACCGVGVCVCDLVEKTQALQSLISYHMKILREAGLVTEQARGKWKFYSLDREAVSRLLSGWEALLMRETEPPRN